jgi:RNA polymerase sigma-70 factor (ECF subfamily)
MKELKAVAESIPRDSVEEAPDGLLAQRAADGDVRAFEVLVRRHGGLVRVYAHRVLGSRNDVDDVAQETFITAWQQLPALSDTSTVRGWLLKIATRKAIDRQRTRHFNADIDEHDQASPADQQPERLAEMASRKSAVSAALAVLPEQQRQCWVLKEIGGYSYDDIAVELSLPVSTVRGLLSRARKNVMTEMEGWR